MQAGVSVMASPTKEVALPLTAPLDGSTNVAPAWLGFGSLFGTRNGFTHLGAEGMNEPVFDCENAGL